jgi:hypothetical protein
MRLLVFVFSFLISLPAFAQLQGSDFVAGDSCTAYPQGATTMVADSDSDGRSVVLICDGVNWVTNDVDSGKLLRAQTSSAISVSNATNTVVSFGAASRNDFSPSDSDGTFFTIPETGYYLVNVYADWSALPSEGRARVKVQENGSTICEQRDVGDSSGSREFQQTVTCILDSVAGDSIAAAVHHQSGANEDVQFVNLKIYKLEGSGGGGGGGASALGDLSDVTLSGPSNGEILLFSGGNWVNGSGGGSSLWATAQEMTFTTIREHHKLVSERPIRPSRSMS